MKITLLRISMLPASLLLGAVSALIAQPTPDSSTADSPATKGRPKVVLVELFTSEGCSSCPPADALLRMINGKRSETGQLIVALSEHVTYWNSLGWVDPFSASTYTERQNAYSRSFGLDTVYTPQMVVNGREQFNGSDRAELKTALRKEERNPTPVDLHIVSAARNGDHLDVTYSVAGGLAGTSDRLTGDLFVVLTDDLDQSSVLRGENSGRNLSHVAVARSIMRLKELHATPGETIQVQLPAEVRNSAGHHLVLFAQQSHAGHVLGVDSAPL